jgi:hypothetical protein
MVSWGPTAGSNEGIVSVILIINREFRIPDSEVDLGKSLELCYIFLPHDIPFVTHIFNVYSRTQNTGNLSIPEDNPMVETMK